MVCVITANRGNGVHIEQLKTSLRLQGEVSSLLQRFLLEDSFEMTENKI